MARKALWGRTLLTLSLAAAVFVGGLSCRKNTEGNVAGTGKTPLPVLESRVNSVSNALPKEEIPITYSYVGPENSKPLFVSVENRSQSESDLELRLSSADSESLNEVNLSLFNESREKTVYEPYSGNLENGTCVFKGIPNGIYSLRLSDKSPCRFSREKIAFSLENSEEVAISGTSTVLQQDEPVVLRRLNCFFNGALKSEFPEHLSVDLRNAYENEVFNSRVILSNGEGEFLADVSQGKFGAYVAKGVYFAKLVIHSGEMDLPEVVVDGSEARDLKVSFGEEPAKVLVDCDGLEVLCGNKTKVYLTRMDEERFSINSKQDLEARTYSGEIYLANSFYSGGLPVDDNKLIDLGEIPPGIYFLQNISEIFADISSTGKIRKTKFHGHEGFVVVLPGFSQKIRLFDKGFVAKRTSYYDEILEILRSSSRVQIFKESEGNLDTPAGRLLVVNHGDTYERKLRADDSIPVRVRIYSPAYPKKRGEIPNDFFRDGTNLTARVELEVNGPPPKIKEFYLFGDGWRSRIGSGSGTATVDREVNLSNGVFTLDAKLCFHFNLSDFGSLGEYSDNYWGVSTQVLSLELFRERDVTVKVHRVGEGIEFYSETGNLK